MRLARSLLLLLVACAGCDSGGDDRPLSPAERLAGTWEMRAVRDATTRQGITRLFEQQAGRWTLTFQSVGCCSEAAPYALTIDGLDDEPTPTRTPIYFPRTAREPWVVTLESPYEPFAISPEFRFDGHDDDLLVLRFVAEDDDLRPFGVDFHHANGFVMELLRTD
ncbi:MAG: hypothetical protein R3362_02670 [Rhodothermales bacterium]|nr:hypothetical protein [Rhodothermales bacterium]